MNDFQKRLEEAEAAAAVPEGPDETVKYWWLETLDDFVGYINAKHAGDVHAQLAGSGVPDAVRLQVAPATRWNEGMTAIMLQGSSDRAIVFGQKQKLFQSRAELEEYLVDFLRSPTFRSTLRELGERNTEPSEGYLRFGGPLDRDPRRDVMVGIPADVQRRIAEASGSGGQVDLGELDAEVLPPNATAQGKIDPRSAPGWLASGGFLVELTGMTIVDEKTVRLRGKTFHEVEAAA